MSEYEALCEICGAKYNNYFRTMYIQYSNNENDKKCTCLKCWREQAVIKPYRYTNHIPDFCDGGNLITILFDTKEDLLKYILQNTKDNKIACISENGDEVIDVNTDEKYWWVRGYANLDKNDLPNWRDKVIELYGENYMERD